MDKIASALVKAQRGFAPALKTSSNPHFRSKYADLSACVEAVIDALNEAGIALIQKQHPHDGGVAVETVFVHESGEMLSAGLLTVPASKQDPQGYGSALTYARRYSLMAACGIAPEDDDGNAASKRPQKPDATVSFKPREDPPTPPIAGRISPAQLAAEEASKLIAPERRAELDALADDMLLAHQEGRDLPAINAYRGINVNEEKIYLWDLLKPAPKLRATIKANRPETRAA